eukprot:scaffold9079_cov120-Cylindrotheca_fusiformis.AAC.5
MQHDFRLKNQVLIDGQTLTVELIELLIFLKAFHEVYGDVLSNMRRPGRGKRETWRSTCNMSWKEAFMEGFFSLAIM